KCVRSGGEARIDAAIFGAIAHAEAGDAMRGERDRLLAVDHHRTRAAAYQPEQCPQGRGPAGAIAAEESHDLTLLDVAGDPVQHVRFAVVGVQVSHAQRYRAHVIAPASAVSADPM